VRQGGDQTCISDYLALPTLALSRDGAFECRTAKDVQHPNVPLADKRPRQPAGAESDLHVWGGPDSDGVMGREGRQDVLHRDRAPQRARRRLIGPVMPSVEDSSQSVAGEGGDLPPCRDHAVDQDGEVPVEQPVQALATRGAGLSQGLCEGCEARQVREQDDTFKVLGDR
jgi:hypothetical protein